MFYVNRFESDMYQLIPCSLKGSKMFVIEKDGKYFVYHECINYQYFAGWYLDASKYSYPTAVRIADKIGGNVLSMEFAKVNCPFRVSK